MLCRQSLCGSFIEIKGVAGGGERERTERERYTEKEEEEEDARTTLPLRKSSRKESGKSQSLSLKGEFCTCVQTT